jgi:Protein of unknown function (DUF2970)
VNGGLREAADRKGSWRRSFQAVAWSFFGIRKGSDYKNDVDQLNPKHVIVAGLVAAAVFVGALVMLVNWVVGSGAAG